MEDPLLPYDGPRRKAPPQLAPFLSSLQEDGDKSLPVPITPSKLKERLIFGPSSSPRDSTPSVEALKLSINSPRSSSSNQDFIINETPQQRQLQQQQSWLFDLNFKRAKTHLHRSKTAPALAGISDNDISHVPKPQFGTQSVVRQAFILLVLYLSIGVVIYWCNRHNFIGQETHPVVDALYFCIVTMCTIGYGDITPKSTSTKLFSILFVLVGFGFIDILLSGMVSYVLDLQESYLLKNAKNDKEAPGFIFDLKKGRMRIRMKVALALSVVVVCIGIGVGVMHFVENLGWIDSFYLSVMSVTTVGYGDRTFKSLPGRIFASVWLLVSTLAVARAFLYFAEARVDKRQRKMAKWILGHGMTVSEFLAADIDQDGLVSKSEYVIYTLKEMGKVSEKDILEICRTFDRIDSGNCGKITLVDLMEAHH